MSTLPTSADSSDHEWASRLSDELKEHVLEGLLQRNKVPYLDVMVPGHPKQALAAETVRHPDSQHAVIAVLALASQHEQLSTEGVNVPLDPAFKHRSSSAL